MWSVVPSVDNRVISIVWHAWLATLDVLVWSVVPSVHLTTITYQVTYQVRPHLIHELEPDEAIGPSGHLVHEESHLVTTKFVQIILEDVDTG